jgi:hypothetical protein
MGSLEGGTTTSAVVIRAQIPGKRTTSRTDIIRRIEEHRIIRTRKLCICYVFLSETAMLIARRSRDGLCFFLAHFISTWATSVATTSAAFAGGHSIGRRPRDRTGQRSLHSMPYSAALVANVEFNFFSEGHSLTMTLTAPPTYGPHGSTDPSNHLGNSCSEFRFACLRFSFVYWGRGTVRSIGGLTNKVG